MNKNIETWQPNPSLLSLTGRAGRYVTKPNLDRIRMPSRTICMLKSDPRPVRITESARPLRRVDQFFEFCSAWCVDVPVEAPSLLLYAERLRRMSRGEPKQKVLLLLSDTQRSKYEAELEQLTDCDIGEREELLNALQRGKERAKIYRLP